MEVTEEQRRRAEANRLAALEKRKRALEASGSSSDPWRLFRCRKVTNPPLPLQKPAALPPLPPPPLPLQPPPILFRVVLEICSPSEFSIVPEALPDSPFPGEAMCFDRIESHLSLNPHRCIQSQIGRKAVYRLEDYDTILSHLKKLSGIQLQEIPYKTRRVVENFLPSIGDRWIPCLPHHLSDIEVDQLMDRLPKLLRDGLLPFQLEGVKFGLRRGGRCLIADEMGLGKTLQAIAIASCFMDEGPVLVVCPAVLRYSWAEELERWLPSCLPTEIHLVFGHQNKLDLLEKAPKVVVISFTMLNRLRRSMLERHWALMIVDESHNLRCTKKKAESGETGTVLCMARKIKRIILLSGTPSLSRPFDIFHQIDMLWPKLLGNDKYEFASSYCSAQVVKGCQGKIYKDYSKGVRLEELNILLCQTLMIRRLKGEVLLQLPPKRRQIIRVKLKGSDISLATLTVKADSEKNSESLTRVSLQSDPSTEEKSSADCSDRTPPLRVSKRLSHQELGIAKLSGFREWFSNHYVNSDFGGDGGLNMEHPSQKTIIFAHHLKVLDGIQEFVCEKSIQFVRIDGSTSARDRKSGIEAFHTSPEVKVAIIGITAGGVGLNFSSAQNVVFLELPKSASEMLQAEDRAHRRGQSNAVNIYIFCAKGTLDEPHWLHLNKSLYRVSSMMNGKINALREIEVEKICNLGGCRNSLPHTNVEAVNVDKLHVEVSVNHKTKGSNFLQVNVCDCNGDKNVPANTVWTEPDASQEEDKMISACDRGNFVFDNELECKEAQNSICASAETIEDVSLDLMARGGEKNSIMLENLKNIFEGEGDVPIKPESLRFQVSQYTGRIHLYVCSLGTHSRPRPLFENFHPEDLESLVFDVNKRKVHSFVKENPIYWNVFQTFIKEWNDLRPIERNKLLGKPLQLPLNLELCFLKETINHGCQGLLKGGSKRRTTPLSDINSNLPSNAIWKNVTLYKGTAKEKDYNQAWTTDNEPLCKLCQMKCSHNLAKKPEYFEDLFCDLSCFEEFRIRTSQKSLREALFRIEHGICAKCQLDCHKLVKSIRPLSAERRREYIQKVAPHLTGKKIIFEKLVHEPSEGNAWHADHIIPVYKGGGECRLENMRTLCVGCHFDVTAAQRAERHNTKLRAKEQLKIAMKEQNGGSDVSVNNNFEEDGFFIHVPGSAYSCSEKKGI